MGPKPKKGKAETLEEKQSKEEELRKQRELEEKKQAEEKRLRELEEAKHQAMLIAARESEFSRLKIELEDREKALNYNEKRLLNENKVLAEEQLWMKFREASDETDAYSEKELNTFITICSETKIKSFPESIELVRKVEGVALNVRERWSNCLAKQDIAGLSSCLSYLTHFYKSIIEYLDIGTAAYLRNCVEKVELNVEEIAKDVMIGLWGSMTDRPGNRKSVQFEKLGVQIDIPKQILTQGRLVHRVIRMPFEAYSEAPYSPLAADATPLEIAMRNSNKLVLGDVFIIEILFPAKESHTIISRKWVMKDSSGAALSARRTEYPSTVPCRCYVKIPDHIVMSNDVRMAVWNNTTNEWSEEGITEFQYSEQTRMVQFYITCLGTFALVKDRTTDFPYRRWSLTPNWSTLSAEKSSTARLLVQLGTVEVTIGIQASLCSLVKTNSKSLLDLMNISMSPGKLLFLLYKRGLNLLPASTDPERAAGLTSHKNPALEYNVLQEVARSAGILEFNSSIWNQQLTANQIGILVKESTIFTSREEKYESECIFVEEDALSASATNAPNVGQLVTNDPKSVAAKFLLVLGNEYGDKRSFLLTPRPNEVPHIELTTCLTSRITAEAFNKIDTQSVQFTDTVFKVLQLLHPYQLS